MISNIVGSDHHVLQWCTSHRIGQVCLRWPQLLLWRGGPPNLILLCLTNGCDSGTSTGLRANRLLHKRPSSECGGELCTTTVHSPREQYKLKAKSFSGDCCIGGSHNPIQRA